MQIGKFNLEITNPFKTKAPVGQAPAAEAPQAPAGDQVQLGSTSAAPAVKPSELSTGKKIGFYATAGTMAYIGAAVGGKVAAACMPLAGAVAFAGVGALVLDGRHIKVNGRELRDILSPFKANESDTKTTSVLKTVANGALRTGVAVAAGAAAGALVPFAGLVAGGVGMWKLGKNLAGKLFHNNPAPPQAKPQQPPSYFAGQGGFNVQSGVPPASWPGTQQSYDSQSVWSPPNNIPTSGPTQHGYDNQAVPPQSQ